MPAITDIADAVVTELKGGSFSQTFTAVRAYKPVFDLAEMKDLHVTVVPKAVEASGSSRSMTQFDVQIDIGVQKRLLATGAGEQAELDDLMALVEEIADFLRQRRLAGAPDASWVRTENNPIFAPEHLDQLRQFTSVLTMTYRILR